MVAKLPGDGKGYFFFFSPATARRGPGGTYLSAAGREVRPGRGVPSWCPPQPEAMAVVLGKGTTGVARGWGKPAPRSERRPLSQPRLREGADRSRGRAVGMLQAQLPGHNPAGGASRWREGSSGAGRGSGTGPAAV